MIRTWIRILFYFLTFLFLQVLVMNNIHLFNIIIPFVYIYVILKLPVDLSRSSVIILSFLLGLSVDLFSNTFGMHAAACSLLGFVREPILRSFVNIRELPEGSIPSYNLFDAGKFIKYTIVLVVIHHVALFTIEAFTFFQPFMMLIRMASSIVLTTILVCIIEAFNLGIKNKGE